MPKDTVASITFETEAARNLYQSLSAIYAMKPHPYEYMQFRSDDHARQVGTLLLPDRPHVHAGNVLQRHLRWLPHGVVGADGWQWRYESYETTALELDLISPSAKEPREAGSRTVKNATKSLVDGGILIREFRKPTGRTNGPMVSHYRLSEPAYCTIVALLKPFWKDDYRTNEIDSRTFRRIWAELRYPTDGAPYLRDLISGWRKIATDDSAVDIMQRVLDRTRVLFTGHH